MIFEHEIPGSSRLYFGKSAKIKRQIEQKCAMLLEEKGYSEIVTPLFSYHQHSTFDDASLLIRVNDSENSQVTLRADSTVDVVRIVTKRLSRSENKKKWFYIQPIFSYPTSETYQIGAEIIDGSLHESASCALELLNGLEINCNFQFANIAIAHILVENYGFDLEDIKAIRLEKILNSKYEWIKDLVNISEISDLNDLSLFPNDIKEQLELLKSAALEIGHKDALVSPLFYAPMRYYNSLVFRAFEGERLYVTGGIYNVNGISGSGFAIYTDAVIAKKMQRD